MIKRSYPTRREFEKLKNQRKVFQSFSGLAIPLSLVMTLSACNHSTEGTMPAPYIMTEQQALNIISVEAEKHGITFDAKNINVSKLPVQYKYNGLSIHKKISFKTDYYNEKLKVGVEFVSRSSEEKDKDLDNISEKIGNIELAKKVNQSLEKSKKYKFVKVFSDSYAPDQITSENLLKEQLKEFFDWLIANDVIVK